MTPGVNRTSVLYVGESAAQDVDWIGDGTTRFDVTTETDPEAALTRHERFEHVVVEHAPPAIDGLSLLRRARADGSDVPFVLVDGDAVVGSDAAGPAVADGGLNEDDLAEEIGWIVDEASPSTGEPVKPTADLHRIINQAIARASTREEIEQSVCERLADSDAGRLVWIGDVDENGVLALRASAGQGGGYLDEVRDTGDWSGAGSGPMGRAIRTHELQYAADVAADPIFEPWREQALEWGHRSVVAIPLVYEGRIQGAIIIYSGEVDPFAPDELTLLGELGTTVAHALEAIDARDQARRFEQAVEHAGHAIYVTDPDGVIEYVNPAFEEITGYGSAEAIGRTPSFLHAEGYDEQRVRNLWETIRGAGTLSEEIHERRKSGEVYLAEQTIAPIGGEGDEGFIAIQNDISVRRQREQRLSVLNRLLRHNLRNDVNVILGRAEFARDHPESTETALTAIEERARNLVDLTETVSVVNRTLDRLRSEARRQEPIVGLLDRTVADAREQYPHASIDLDVPEELDRPVPTAIEVAMEELLQNAVTHNDSEAPEVRVVVSELDGTGIEVAVIDDGPGLPRNERETLEQGYETQLTHGLGLGLWFVHWTVTSVGGSIAIDETGSGGTVARVRLPTATSAG